MNVAFGVLRRFVYNETAYFERNEEAMSYYRWDSYIGYILNEVRETIVKACVNNNYHGRIAVSELVDELNGCTMGVPFEEKIALEIGNYITTDEDFNIMQLLFNLLDTQEEYAKLVYLFGTNSYGVKYIKTLIRQVAHEAHAQKILGLEKAEYVYELIDHLGQWSYTEEKFYERLKEKYDK